MKTELERIADKSAHEPKPEFTSRGVLRPALQMADISVTWNTYTHVNYDDAKEELQRVANS